MFWQIWTNPISYETKSDKLKKKILFNLSDLEIFVLFLFFKAYDSYKWSFNGVNSYDNQDVKLFKFIFISYEFQKKFLLLIEE